MEAKRRLASYLSASMLALPIGLLPLIIKGLIIRIWYSSVPVTSASPVFAFASDSMLAALAILIALMFVVFMSIRSDLIFEQASRRARALLETTDAGLLVLDGLYAAAIEEQVSFRMLPEVLGIQIEKDLKSRIEHFAHYHRWYGPDHSLLGKRRIWMALRQTPGLNLLLAFLCSLCCFALVGFLLLPLLLRRLYVNWPTVSAYRLEFVATMHDSQLRNQQAASL
jgi:hypothetical protein